jgi:hypothetical protein
MDYSVDANIPIGIASTKVIIRQHKLYKPQSITIEEVLKHAKNLRVINLHRTTTINRYINSLNNEVASIVIGPPIY